METGVKQEIYEDLGRIIEDRVKTLKEETVDFYDVEQSFGKPTLEIERGESKYDVIKTEQNECDGADKFIDNELHDIENEYRESSVHRKQEDNDNKYDDLEAEVTGQPTAWRHISENDMRVKKLRKGEESSNNLKAAELGIVNKLKCEVKERLEVDLYKCLKCSYATKRAGSLNSHMLVHKCKSEVRLYKCQECSYVSKRAGDLKIHMLVHKSKSEVTLSKCQECSYVAKYAPYLKKHMLVHKSKSEVRLYRCQECSYTAKQVGNLKKHILVHKSESEVRLYKCQECSFASKRAAHVKRHMLIHEAKSEVALYKCHQCSYATNQTYNVKRHMLVHKAESDVSLYEC